MTVYYWPNAKYIDNTRKSEDRIPILDDSFFTYDSQLTLEECQRCFDTWDMIANTNNWTITERWIDVRNYDNDKKYRLNVTVEKRYVFEKVEN